MSNIKILNDLLVKIDLAESFNSDFCYTGEDIIGDMFNLSRGLVTEEEFDLKYRRPYTQEELQKETETRHKLLDGVLDLDIQHGFAYNLALEWRTLMGST